MDIRHIKYFLTLSEELHFRRASEKLFIAQPALSRQIKELEEELGITLFNRNKRHVELTPAGKYFQEEGYRLLSQFESLQTSVKQIGSTPTGTLKIGCIGSAMVHIVPNLLKQLNEELPMVYTNLMEDTTQNLLNMLMDNQIDVLIGRDHQLVTNVQSERISTDSAVVVTGRNNPWNLGPSSSLSQLNGVPLILYPREAGTRFRDHIVNECAKHDFFPMIKYESINAYSILRLVEVNLGVTILPQSITEGYRCEIDHFPMPELNMPLSTVMSYRTDHKSKLKERAISLLRNLVN